METGEQKQKHKERTSHKEGRGERKREGRRGREGQGEERRGEAYQLWEHHNVESAYTLSKIL